MKRIETPQVVQDLYRDLRDRRLLFPAIALLVAILAVPILLASGEEPLPPAPATALPDGAEEVSAAVLTDQPGIRDYRKRLSALKDKNPFDAPAAPKASDGSSADDLPLDEDIGAAPPGTTLPTGPSGPSDGGKEPTSPTPPISQPAPDTGRPDRNPDTGKDDKPQKPEIRFFTGRVDIAFGPPGEAKLMKGVRELDFIPNDKRLIAGFIGLAGNGKRAVFSLAPEVVETSGDGSCAPKKPAQCQFVRLAEGESRRLVLADGTKYVLRLVETYLVRVPDPR